jgi:hypothetical protein
MAGLAALDAFVPFTNDRLRTETAATTNPQNFPFNTLFQNDIQR